MQSAFFKLAEIIPADEAIDYMKAAAKKSYAKKGEDVVQKNYAAIDIGVTGITEINYPEAWATATSGATAMHVSDDPYFVDFIKPILAFDLPYIVDASKNRQSAAGEAPTVLACSHRHHQVRKARHRS